MVEQDVLHLLYLHDHVYAGTKEKNEHAQKLTDALGVGEHTVDGRKIVVDKPIEESGWTRYRVKEVYS